MADTFTNLDFECVHIEFMNHSKFKEFSMRLMNGVSNIKYQINTFLKRELTPNSETFATT